MSQAFHNALWPVESCSEMIACAIHFGHLPVRESRGVGTDPEACCNASGLECARIALRGVTLESELRLLGPGVLEVPGFGYLLILRSGRSGVQALTPSLRTTKISIPLLVAFIHETAAKRALMEVEDMLAALEIPEQRRRPAARAILTARLRNRFLGNAFHIRVPPGRNFLAQLVKSGTLRDAVLLLGAHFLEVACLILAWICIGNGALSGRIDPGWLLTWALLLITTLPLHLLTTWLQGTASVGLGVLLRLGCLAGALLLDHDAIRGEGLGQMLGRVLESEAVESLAVSGGLSALLALVEAAATFFVIAAGAVPIPQASCFAISIAFAVLLALRYAHHRSRWTNRRLGLTRNLIEKMVGHRTRLVQESSGDRHSDEDQLVDEYVANSLELDDWGASLSALPSGVWLILSSVALAPQFFLGTHSSVQVAISLGGMLLGYQSLRRISFGSTQIVGAAIAWRRVSPIFRQATHLNKPPMIESSPLAGRSQVVEARDLMFTYPRRAMPAVIGCSLCIRLGEKLLVDGNSGSGKSTLAALLSASRQPDAGMLLAGGLDHHTLGGDGWSKRIVVVPQYHENHILSAPLAFNLLMGRRWPPTETDLRQIAELCSELGLGPLLARMPGGLMQMVGETGWQLSQGERSRVFLARALLQSADLTILDETFAALDPENLRSCVECALRRSRTLLVIAHT